MIELIDRKEAVEALRADTFTRDLNMYSQSLRDINIIKELPAKGRWRFIPELPTTTDDVYICYKKFYNQTYSLRYGIGRYSPTWRWTIDGECIGGEWEVVAWSELPQKLKLPLAKSPKMV